MKKIVNFYARRAGLYIPLPIMDIIAGYGQSASLEGVLTNEYGGKHEYRFVGCSAMDGNGLWEGLAWIHDRLSDDGLFSTGSGCVVM